MIFAALISYQNNNTLTLHKNIKINQSILFIKTALSVSCCISIVTNDISVLVPKGLENVPT